MTNRLREKLLKAERPLGTFVQMEGATIVECLAIAGLDYIVLDTEHGSGEVQSVMQQIIAAERHGMTSLVRIKDASRASVMRMLDSGAQGLIIPFIKTVQEVEQIVRYGKYSPLGERGFGPSRLSSFSYSEQLKDLNTYFETSNRETLIIPQCETRECLESIDDIVRVPGIDGILIGPFDLSIALGKPAQFTDETFLAAIERVLAACKKAGKFCFIFADRTIARRRFEQGFDSVAISTDTIECIKAFRTLIGEVSG